jgi:glutaredoxin-related protein
MLDASRSPQIDVAVAMVDLKKVSRGTMVLNGTPKQIECPVCKHPIPDVSGCNKKDSKCVMKLLRRHNRRHPKEPLWYTAPKRVVNGQMVTTRDVLMDALRKAIDETTPTERREIPLEVDGLSDALEHIGFARCYIRFNQSLLRNLQSGTERQRIRQEALDRLQTTRGRLLELVEQLHDKDCTLRSWSVERLRNYINITILHS